MFSEKEYFILNLLNYKKNGIYVELGAYHSTEQSNTYNLENSYNWLGISLEVDDKRREEFCLNRINPCFGDALTFDYLKYFEQNNFPKNLDFLQINIDSSYNHITGRPIGSPANPLLALCAVPMNLYRFSIITFEHDTNMYFRNSNIRDAQRTILDALGYSLVCCTPSEDWWVDPQSIPMIE